MSQYEEVIDKPLGSELQLHKGTYTGTWDKTTNLPHGFGKYTQNNIKRYEGEWDQGQWSGQGTCFDEAGIIVCKGIYSEGNLHGYCTKYAEDGVTIEQQGNYYKNIFVGQMTMEECEKLLKEQEEQEKQEEEEQQQQQQQQQQQKIITASMSFQANTSYPPIHGFFPRYSVVPQKMLDGAQLWDLEDHEIPNPTNLAGTREEWIAWIRAEGEKNKK